MRLACMRLRDAPLAALVRLEPELNEQPVGVVDVAGTHGRIVASTELAQALGVRLGQTAHQARALAPELIVRVVDASAVQSTRAALLDAAGSVAPSVEPEGDRVYVDASAMRRMYPNEAGFAAALTRAAERIGLHVDVGIAGTKSTARVAASSYGSASIVPPGGERDFLAALPIEALPMSPELRAEFRRMGVKTLGAIAALPERATATRLGPESARAIAMARGRDDSPLIPRPHATRFEEAMDLEWEVHEVEALTFVIKRLLDALMNRLVARSLAVSSVVITLSLGSRVRDERTLTLPAATRDVKTLVHLARASMESRPPSDAVVGVRVMAVAAGVRGIQLDLFDPPGPTPEVLALTLARLAVLVGEERVGQPVVPNTHRPHAASSERFDLGGRKTLDAPDANGPGVALHVFRPPKDAQVVLRAGRMVRVVSEGIDAGVQACCGPFRVTGEWWNQAFEHDGYDVELADGGVYLVAFDAAQSRWKLDGVYE